MVLILGIASLTICPPAGPAAWYLGNRALGQIDHQRGVDAGLRRVQAGRMCGIISSCLLVTAAVLAFVVFVGPPYSIEP